jgi:hypothetical protein
MHGHKFYVWFLLCGMVAILSTVIYLNLLLAENSTAARNVFAASEWQHKTHGITNATRRGVDNRPFKTLRLNDRLPDINTVIFGSSTSMGIQQEMFPELMRIYNFTQNGNTLSYTIGEIEYLLDHASHIKWMIVELDWALGFVYRTDPPPPTDLSIEHVSADTQAAGSEVSKLAAIRDGLTYPRVINLLKLLGSIALSGDVRENFRKNFSQTESDEYVCPDGLAKDFDQNYRGLCAGFVYDGSSNFRIMPRLTDARAVIAPATFPGLVAAQGEPNRSLLDRAAAQAKRLESTGGRMIFIIPPLVPALEVDLMARKELAPLLTRTKTVLLDWAERHNVLLFDAGRSERFGCVASEFVDAIHAVPECYRKVLRALWESLNQRDCACNIDPPASSYAIMRRARAYRGENSRPSKNRYDIQTRN